jgi:hypothetical protein
VSLNEVPDFFELGSKKVLPVKLANRVRGKGDEVGSYPEEQNVVIYVEPEHFQGTIQVVLDSLDQALF